MRVAFILLIILFLEACSSQRAHAPNTIIELRPATYAAQAGWAEMTEKDTQRKIYLSEAIIISSSDISSAQAMVTEQGMPVVSMTLTEVGKQKFALATERYINQPIGIVVNGDLLSAPVIREKITGGMIMISGIATLQDAQMIANGLNK